LQDAFAAKSRRIDSGTDRVIEGLNPPFVRSMFFICRLMRTSGAFRYSWPDRNLVNFSFNTGVTLKAPFAGRDSDTVGLGYGFGQISGSASSLDKDVRRFTGTNSPVRSSESFIELTYQAQIAPWWLVQPDLQYVWNPGGGLENPQIPGQRIKNELVLGMRTNITF
jgi:porin